MSHVIFDVFGWNRIILSLMEKNDRSLKGDRPRQVFIMILVYLKRMEKQKPNNPLSCIQSF